ncbi:hypothetical protein LOTGIDRAFT_133451 [Lottia gigantea]|uniref:Cytochrome b5 reductase 4 n=1 Tax=Lottia gigantea TaxID=225164 RepID=V3ZRD3_LOTGI|nr:hypothetical protein LOTGIDRAFT_133451 [Lottia gigantea]ESO83431.1 hypothetical protein LOTGIDRAFT_133451 [Lottia gigantea]
MASNSLNVPSFPSTNSQQRISTADTTVRVKVSLKPGRSLMDWIRLGRSGQDLTGVGGQILEVSEEELAKHNTQEDGWLSLRGKVYNVTPYMEYHPGGIDELKRGLGKDATQLFDEIHKWVNAESMLEKCLVGKLVTTSVSQRKGNNTYSWFKQIYSSYLICLNSLFKMKNNKLKPQFDWYQTNKTITLVVYTKWGDMSSEYVIISKEDKELTVNVNIKDLTFIIHTELEDGVSCDYSIKTSKDGKVEIVLPKIQLDKQWSGLGKSLDKHCTYKKTTELAVQYHECKLESVCNITHDVKLFCLRLPESTWMCVPIGYHIHVHHIISGMEIVRSYTCVSPSLTNVDNTEGKGRLIYLMIKIYPDGAITPWLNSLNIGDTVDISNYDGHFNSQRLDNDHQLVLYAAGTGFTPMVRLIHRSLQENSKIKSVKLLFFNKKLEDIVWKDQLDQLATNSKNRFEVKYILSEADDSWTGLKGRIRKELVSDHLPKTVDSNTKLLVCACGPIPFTKEVMR